MISARCRRRRAAREAHPGHVTGSVSYRPWTPSANVPTAPASGPGWRAGCGRMRLATGLCWSGIRVLRCGRSRRPRLAFAGGLRSLAGLRRCRLRCPGLRRRRPSVPPPSARSRSLRRRRCPTGASCAVAAGSPPVGRRRVRPLSPWWPPASSRWARCPAGRRGGIDNGARPQRGRAHPRPGPVATVGQAAVDRADELGVGVDRVAQRLDGQVAGELGNLLRQSRPAAPEPWPVSGRRRPRSTGPPARRSPGHAPADRRQPAGPCPEPPATCCALPRKFARGSAGDLLAREASNAVSCAFPTYSLLAS